MRTAPVMSWACLYESTTLQSYSSVLMASEKYVMSSMIVQIGAMSLLSF
jgi:hypothetical protein